MLFLYTITWGFFSWHTIAAIKKKYIVCRDWAGALQSFIFLSFHVCNVNYLYLKRTISGLGFKIRNSLPTWGRQSCQSPVMLLWKWLLLNAVLQYPVWLVFHHFWFLGEASVYLWFSQELHPKCPKQKKEEDKWWWGWLSWAWNGCPRG